MKTEIKLNRALARKVLEIVDAGLVTGLGVPKPGGMCIEAAVCFALGLPHGDQPPCVGRAVRSFKIRLNDSRWTSDTARAAGMRSLAVAQLGSDAINQVKFAELLALKTCRVFLPLFLRAEMLGGKFEELALACEQATDLESCTIATHDAADTVRAAAKASVAAAVADPAKATHATAYATAHRGLSAAFSAAVCAVAAAHAAVSDAHATTNGGVSAAHPAHAAANAAVSAIGAVTNAALSAAHAAHAAHADNWLVIMADLGLECLMELNSPGCEWLDLCDNGKAGR